MSGQGLEGWDEDELVMISALEHWSYCPRQCALIHLEQTFDENLYTLKGRMMHERTDEPTGDSHDGLRIERALTLWSNRLGLVGKADVVEFHGATPYPVEYKHGPRRQWGHDDLQLCAQAICLEEMMGTTVPAGAVYHYGSRRRREVVFNEVLRVEVRGTVEAVRRMLARSHIPPPVNDARCRHCSLKESCLPSVVGDGDRVRAVCTSLFSVHGDT
jgi:CRISPR-associated exonuclease Cas4